MKNLFNKKITNVLASMAILFLVINFSCQKSVSENQNPSSTDPTLNEIIAKADSAVSPYNLNVILQGPNNALGFIKFRQNPDTSRIINLHTWVFNLKPYHTYLLQRAVNVITNPTHCSSTAWLTLGKGLTPQAIHTDKWGFGSESLWRDVSSVARGTEFYIHFQVIDSLTSEAVLSSDCHTYMVR